MLSSRGRAYLAGALVVLAVATGVAFRLHEPGRKLFWHDESWTALWISGIDSETAHRELERTTWLSREDLERHQRLQPGRGMEATLRAVGKDDPKQMPLYFILLRLWCEVAGDSDAAMRLFSAACSLVALAGMWWLTIELTGSVRISALALALAALSPFHVVYAQEARAYALLTAIIVLSTAALLRAMNRQGSRWWIVYAALVVAGAASHALYWPVPIAHMLHVAFTQSGSARRKALAAIAGACLLAIAALTPWLGFVVAGRETLRSNSAWIVSGFPRTVVVKHFLLTMSGTFVEPEGDLYLLAEKGLDRIDPWVARLPLFVFCVMVVVAAIRNEPRTQWMLPVALLAPILAGLLLPDLLFGGRRSTPRFVIPAVLALQIAAALCLARWSASARALTRALAMTGTFALLAGGAVSLLAYSGETIWWNKLLGSDYASEASRVSVSSRTSSALLVHDSVLTMMELQAISRLLPAGFRYALVTPPEVPADATRFDRLYLFGMTLSDWKSYESQGHIVTPDVLARIELAGSKGRAQETGEPVSSPARQP